MSTLASLMVQIGADTARLSTDMNKATNLIQGFTRKAESAFKGLAATALAAFSFNAIVTGMKQAVETMDKLNESAQKVGMSVESLQVWQMAAKQVSVESEAFEKAVGRLAKNAYNTADIFENIGISATDSSGELKTMDALLPELADKFSKMSDGTQKTALAIELFGKTGAQLIPILNRGSEEIENLRKQMGYIASAEDTKRADQFNDTLDLMKRRSEGMKMAVMSGALPALQDLANAFTNTKNTGEAFYSVGESIGYVLKVLAHGAIGTAAAFDIMGTYIGQSIGKAVAMSKAFGSGGIEGWKNLYNEWKTPGADLVGPKMERYGTMIENIWKGSAGPNMLKRSIAGGTAKPGGGGTDMASAMLDWRKKIEGLNPFLDEMDKKLKDLDLDAAKLVEKFGAQGWIQEGLDRGKEFLEITRMLKQEVHDLDQFEFFSGEMDGPFTEEDLTIMREWIKAMANFEDEFETATTNARSDMDSFLKGAQHEVWNLDKSIKSATQSMEDSFVEFCKTGEFNFTAMANSMIDDLARVAFKVAMFGNMTGDKQGGEYGGLLGLGMGVLGSLFGGGGGLTGQSMGAGDWTEGLGFAKGGIITRPSVFPMANGGVGLAGEAGTEGILPLKRTPSGDLGVSAEGGGGGTNIFISAVDSKSFLDMCQRNPGAILGPVEKALQNNQSLRGTIRRTS